MKTLGIIGGIGPESTIEYYRAVVALWQQRMGDGSYPSVIINSVDLHKLLGLMEANALEQVTEYLAHEIGRLADAGADFALLAANTPHIVFDDVQRRVSIPLISIVQATCEVAEHMQLKKLGLVGTQFTMQAHFYQDRFVARGIALAIPDDADREYIHQIYFQELVKGIILPETRERLLAIVARMKEQHGLQGLILGGTELPLILRPGMDPDIPFLDTTQIHVEAAIDRLLAV